MDYKSKSKQKNNSRDRRPEGSRPHSSDRRNQNTRPYAEKPRAQERDAAPVATEDVENGLVIGRNAVRELLKSDRTIDKLLVQRGERTGSIVVLVAQAIEKGIPVVETDKAKLDAMAGFAPHQGVIAQASEKEYCTVEDILAAAREKNEPPFLVLCDGVTDPYNLGAIIRSAVCCGAHGLVIPKRRASGLTPLVTKASAGAIEHLPIAKVANIANTVEQLKKEGVWVFAAEAGGPNVYDTDFTGPCAIVMGSEGDGVSQSVVKACDGIVSIPIYGEVNSFNVSAATAIILAEVARQHHKN